MILDEARVGVGCDCSSVKICLQSPLRVGNLNIGIFILHRQNMDFSDNKKDKMKFIFLFSAKMKKIILQHVDLNLTIQSPQEINNFPPSKEIPHQHSQ